MSAAGSHLPPTKCQHDRGRSAATDRRSPPSNLGFSLAFGLAGLVADFPTTPRGAPRNVLQLGVTFWHFRHESRVTSPPAWIQNLMLPPLWTLARALGKRPYYDHWDSRIDNQHPD